MQLFFFYTIQIYITNMILKYIRYILISYLLIQLI
jgi:hypothetical protein